MSKSIDNLKAKYKENGIGILSEQEKTALLLSYADKGDTVEETAEKICDKYGNLYNAADCDISYLMKECDINLSSAVLINLVSQVSRVTEINDAMRIRLNTVENAKKFFTSYFKGRNTEVLAAVVTDKNFKINNISIISYGGFSEVHAPIRSIADFALKNECKYVFIAHNHPKSDNKPSPSDIKSTIEIKNAVDVIGIPLVDHIITGNNGGYSLRANKGDIFTEIKEYKL